MSHRQPGLTKRLSYRTRNRIQRAGLYLFLAIGLFIVLFPVFWMFSNALRPNAAMFSRPVQLLPNPITFENYEAIFVQSEYVTFYWNSVVVTAGVVVVTTLVATLGGYGLARLDLRHKKTFARAILFGYMFPAILLSIPMYVLWSRIGIVDSQLGLVLAITAITLPFSLWLMWQFFQTVPYSLEESAQMAGATRFQAFYEIALPIARPGMAAIAIFSYAIAWNQYTIPKVIMNRPENWVVTIGLDSFVQQNQVLWGQLLAAASLAVLPGFVLVYFLQRYLIGLRVGNV